LNWWSPIRHGGALSAAAIIVPDGKRGKNPRILSEYYDFQRKSSLLNTNPGGFVPRRCGSPLHDICGKPVQSCMLFSHVIRDFSRAKNVNIVYTLLLTDRGRIDIF
jgi:hypothetical protein